MSLTPTQFSSPTFSPYDSSGYGYAAQCAGSVYQDPAGGYSSQEEACDNCQVDPITDMVNQNEVGFCSNTAPFPINTTVYTGAGWNTGGGPTLPVQTNAYGQYVQTNENDYLWGGTSSPTGSPTGSPTSTTSSPSVNYQTLWALNAGLGGGKASGGLSHTQIILIILLVLVIAGTGAFFLFRHLKK
jgi:hypothetical protein